MRNQALIKYGISLGSFVAVGIFMAPYFALASAADTQCSSTGFTIATINGIFTDEQAARENMVALSKFVDYNYQNQTINYQYLLNPSHIGGFGDILKSIYQGAFDQETVEDYDLVEMLRSASEKVHTQKLLLVGHSQGNFYANSFYDTVADRPGGVPARSIGVYSVATPASRVAGGGQWLTSDTDTIIAKIVGRLPFKSIMPPNTHITLQSGDDPAGHNFKDIYLKYRAPEIVYDIQSSLKKLSSNNVQDENAPCLVPSKTTLAHELTGALFAVADPAAHITVVALATAGEDIYQVGTVLANAAADAVSLLGSALNAVIKLPSGAVGDTLVNNSITTPTADMVTGNSSTQGATPATSEPPTAVESPDTSVPALLLPELLESGPTEPVAESLSRNISATSLSASAEPYHDYGGGADRVAASVPLAAVSNDDSNANPIKDEAPAALPGDNVPPDAPHVLSPGDFSQTFTDSEITFQGTAEATSTISTDYNSATTTADAGGAWRFNFHFPEGTSTVRFFATDAAGNTSSSTEIYLLVDSVAPPQPVLTISECASSLSSAGCLIATTTATLRWQGTSDDLAYYELSYGNIVSTTTATSQVLHLDDDADYDFALRARDRAGNWSEAAEVRIHASTMPVVINEVAWAGTAKSSSDEWIELYNRTSLPVMLDHWSLGAEDGTPYINLAGEISSRGYYLIERGDDDEAISDIAADLSVPFSGTGSGSGLEDNGETLSLWYFPSEFATTTMDKTAVTGSGAWAGGDKNLRRSMERYSPDLRGDSASSWGTNNGLIRNGLDADDHVISGTPRARNSLNYLIAQGAPFVSGNVNLTKARSPYLVNNALQVFQPGSTLTIEPGVVIKFYNDAGLKINGSVDVRGTQMNPIVFTSFKDDNYGGDLNGDGTSTQPAAADWYGVNVKSESGSVIFDHAAFRYGGKYYNGTGNHQSDLYIENTNGAQVGNSVFEYSRQYGMHLLNSGASLLGNEFRLNNYAGDSDAAGALAEGGTPSITNNIFSRNRTGLYLSNSEAVVAGNIFSDNTGDAMRSSGFLGTLAGNTGSGNTTNGIVIENTLTRTGGSATLQPNNLPYVVRDYYPSVAASSTLLVESGTVLKSKNRIRVDGRLKINGENSGDVILTSLYDDAVGGDTNHDATSTSPAAGQWYGIEVRSGGSVDARGFTLRYAGSETYGGSSSGGITLNGALANIANALFDANYPSGIYAINRSSVTIQNARFENHTKIGAWGRRAAFELANSPVSLLNVSFANNLLGIAGDLLSGVIASGVEFVNNAATTSPANLF